MHIWRFPAKRVHCEGEDNSIWIQGVGSGRDFVPGTFAILGVTSSWHYWGFHAPYLFIFIDGLIIAQGTILRGKDLHFYWVDHSSLGATL